MFHKHLGKLIKYEGHFWVIEKIEKGQAELWYNGKCEIVPLDDLNESDVVESSKQ